MPNVGTRIQTHHSSHQHTAFENKYVPILGERNAREWACAPSSCPKVQRSF